MIEKNGKSREKSFLSMKEQQERLTMLVDSFRNGNERVFADIYEMTERDLNVYAIMLMKDPDRAQDLLQDTYIKVVESIHTLRDPARFLPWAKMILHNLAMTEFRRSGKAEILLDEDKEEIFDDIKEEEIAFLPGAGLDRRELQEIVFDVIKRLPVEQRVAMVAYYYDEMSVKDIAEMMGCSEGTVKSRLFHGRKAFKGKIEAYEKRHNIKLHSAAPLLFMGFAGLDSAAAPTASAAAKTFSGVVAKTGIGAAGYSGAGFGAGVHGAAVNAGHTAGAAGVKAGSAKAVVVKTAAGSSVKKIVAAVTITALTIGGGAAVHHAVTHDQTQPETKAVAEESTDTEALSPREKAMARYKEFLENHHDTVKEFRIDDLGEEIPALIYGEEEQGLDVRKVSIIRYDESRDSLDPLGTLESASGNGRIFYRDGRLYTAGYLNGQDFTEYVIEDGEISARGFTRTAGGIRSITYKGPLRAAEGQDLKANVGEYIDSADGDVITKLENDYKDSVLILEKNNETNRNKIK